MSSSTSPPPLRQPLPPPKHPLQSLSLGWSPLKELKQKKKKKKKPFLSPLDDTQRGNSASLASIQSFPVRITNQGENLGFDENHGSPTGERTKILDFDEKNLILVNENSALITKSGLGDLDFTRGNNGLSSSEEEEVDDEGIHSKVLNSQFVEGNNVISNVREKLVKGEIENLGTFGMDSDFNSLMLSLFRAKKFESVEKLFYDLVSLRLSPNSYSFSIMIRCLCEKNEPIEAKRILDEMILNGFYPNVVTFTFLIDCLCKRGRLSIAYEVLKIMRQSGCEPTIRTYNCLINGLCYVGRVEAAFDLLKKIEESLVKPDIYSFTTVMDGFCKVGRSKEAKMLLKEALELGLEPSTVTFNCLINGYCKEGSPLEGLRLLKEMKERNCKPDLISYSTLLHGLLKCSKDSVALRVYNEMVEFGFQSHERMVNTLVRRICRQSFLEAERLFEGIKAKGSCPSPYTYCLMIQAFAMRGKTDKAITNLCDMIRVGYLPRMKTYDMVIRALCGEGRVEDAFVVLVFVLGESRISSRDSYGLMIDELNRQERSICACLVYGLALKQGVVLHQRPKLG
ncbi:hypothetical protein QJS04_geneDACA005828 [Acorus gramineus]|uniref:Pentatricopeptide repeat-containing protein n=1 Tax=Acorus gramineus TaxID=55184 RepID=A0AAV9B214_ACOGR|nr:hypothetical protein QJS04_geneDACA005828 [Acorus gramineus]